MSAGARWSRRGALSLAAGLLSAAAARPASGEDAGRERVEGGALTGLFSAIARARASVRSMRASFTQERALRLLATRVRSTGELAFTAPDRLRWELAPPDDVVYFVGPEGLTYRTRSSRATLPEGTKDVARALADLRALVAGDPSTLGARFTLGATRGPSDVEIEGVARDPSATVKSFSLVIDRGLVVPVRARLVEGKSDTIDLVFSNVAVNVPVDPSRMRP